MTSKLLGGVLLVVGTAIGAGMLALPIATAELGFVGSVFQLLVCWCIMTIGALVLLEANLWLPQNSNLVSMAKQTIGPIGQILTWVIYLLLLYSLLCAYISGGTDLFNRLLSRAGFHVPAWLALVMFTSVFSSVVYLGLRAIDYTNRLLMIIKFSSLFILLLLLIPIVSVARLEQGNLAHITSSQALMITITSFGFSAIIPSLRIYFAGDIALLKKAILIGSVIPLICYILWDAVIMGVIPLQGGNGLLAINDAHRSTSALVSSLTLMAGSHSIALFTNIFTSICVLTSFLGVSLCLTDFWADALQLEKKGGNKLIIHLMMLMPPFIIVLFFPNIFLRSLEYAGVNNVLLMLFIPAWMVWNGRYKKKIAHGYEVAGGKSVLIALCVITIGLLVWNVID